MNNFYTLQKIAGEIHQTLVNSCFDRAVSFRKHRLELYFTPAGSQDPEHITFSSHPKRICIFQSSYFPPKKKDIVTFFEVLEAKVLKSVEVAGEDRFIDFIFEEDYNLRFQLFGHGANCYLYDGKGDIHDAFRGAKKLTGTNVPEPKAPVYREQENLSGNAEQKILQRNPKLPRRWISDLVIHHDLEKADDPGIVKITDQLSSDLLHYPQPTLAYDTELCIIPEKWLPLERTRFDSFNEAVRASFTRLTRTEHLHQGKARLKKMLEGEQKRLKSRIKEADNAIKALERAESYEKYANLLMAHENPATTIDADVLQMSDFYGDGELVKIPVKPATTPLDNANRYYKKARDARKSAEMTQGMGERARSELGRISRLLTELQSVNHLRELEDFEQQNENLLASINRASASGGKTKPFKVVTVNGHEVWIGKNAKSNDALLRSAHKEDLWFHSRDGAGSHVLIRMQGKRELPDQALMEKVAAIAAYHSKASGSSLVPVRYARRKHLRKAKGAPAGEVKVDNEEVILTEPKSVDEVAA